MRIPTRLLLHVRARWSTVADPVGGMNDTVERRKLVTMVKDLRGRYDRRRRDADVACLLAVTVLFWNEPTESVGHRFGYSSRIYEPSFNLLAVEVLWVN